MFFRRVKNDDVVCISEVILHAQFFFDVVVEIRQIQVRKILRKVVSNRQTFAALRACYVVVRINDFVKQYQQAFVFYLSANYLLQDTVINTFVELSNVYLQTVRRAFSVVVQCFLNVHCALMYAALLDARIRLCDERIDPNRFKNIHNCMMNDSVGEIRQTTNLSFFRFEDCERIVWRSVIFATLQHFVKFLQVRFTLLVELTNAERTQFSFARFFVSDSKIVDADDGVVYVADSFHSFACFSRLLRYLYQSRLSSVLSFVSDSHCFALCARVRFWDKVFSDAVIL